MTRTIKLLNQDVYAIVDDSDFEWLNKSRWLLSAKKGRMYAERTFYKNGKKSKQPMHTLITGYERTDHKDGNGLNNCRDNLREATQSQNSKNRRKLRPASSIYKGVVAKRGKWYAQIGVDYKRIALGYHDTELEAARAYDNAAIQYFGEFAQLNLENHAND